MDSGTSTSQGLSKTVKRTVLASFLGSTFEWYDFVLYTTVAALVFDKVFFPTENATVGTLSALVTVAIGYITRPLGALIFGHFGDKVGRKSLLVITMLIMGLPTLIIGLLPGYATIGVAAPILLLVCRLLQGIGLGGEYAGAALATIESVPEEERGFYGSIPSSATPSAARWERCSSSSSPPSGATMPSPLGCGAFRSCSPQSCWPMRSSCVCIWRKPETSRNW
jgi:MHS family shikimate/dehydroshikimate transporter-like MFS transporter